MVKQRNILFDLDDTLIPTQEVYDRTKQEALEFVYEALNQSTKKNEILEIFDIIDKENVSEYGLSRKRFPTSWVQTLNHFGKTEKQTEEKLNEIANRVFEENIQPFEEVEAVLFQLSSEGYALSILTAGDVEVQEKRIEDAKIKEYFKNLYILPQKTVESVSALLKGESLENYIMIGNSLRSDIYPSLELGMKAVHIDKQTWAYDIFDVDKNNQNYYTSTLSDVPTVIKNIIKG